MAQSNKKKIETLQRRFDSIASVLNQQVVSYGVLSQEIDKLKLIVSYLQIKNDSLQKDLEETKSMIRKEKIAVDRNKIKLDTINVDTIKFELRKFPYRLKS
ncbi:MAG: hypothetical protein ACK452_15065, partial [Bacteroidota bacterium]